MQGLANPDLKLRRAKEHLDSLERAVLEFIESKPYGISRYDDLAASEYVIEVQFSSAPIWPIGLILGDFVQCLRSSLDHLIHGLCRLQRGIQFHELLAKKTFFPIIGEFNSGTLATIRDQTEGIPAEALSIVQSLQPYNHGGDYKLTHLWRLHLLSIIDKHRHVSLHSGSCYVEFPPIPKNMLPPQICTTDDR